MQVVGPDRRGQRARDRDARPRLLHPRRHRAAAAVRRRDARRGRRVTSSSPPTRSARRRRRDDRLPAEEAGAEADARDPRQQRAGDPHVRGRRGGVGAARARWRRPRRRGRRRRRRQRSGGRRTGCRRLRRRNRRRPRSAAEDDPRRRWPRARRPPTAPMVAGLNRFTWDLRYAPATSFPGMVLWGGVGQRPGGAARHLPGAADGRRQDADRSRSSSSAIRCARDGRRPEGAVRPRRSRSATRSARRTTP